MSEIYSPGSIAGPQGTPGPAGSQGSVTALASSLLPAAGNLFNFAAAQANYVTDNDGTISFHAPGTIGGGPPYVTNLMYCPGATQLICNSTIAADGFGPGAWIQLFDANGDFTGALAAFGTYHLDPGGAITLPGTQVYVRLSLAGGMTSWDGIAETMIYVGTSAEPATLPGSFTSFAPYVSTTVDANIATALTTAKGLSLAGDAGLLNLLVPENANVWDASVATTGYACKNDGTLVATSYFGGNVTASGFILCPGATSFITNTLVLADNFDGSGDTVSIQLFDSEKNYLGNSALPTDPPNFASIALPGTQTYMRFTTDGAPGTAQGGSPAYVMVYLAKPGATVYPMSAATPWTPFYGKQVINGYARTTVSKASELGCALNCNILTGGGTDDHALLQAFLNTASATNPIKLILDGCAYIGAGLIIAQPGYTTIEGTGWQSGLFLGNNVNQNVITAGANITTTNYTAAGPYGAAAAGSYAWTLPTRSTANVVLRDFTINPNSIGQTSDGFGVLFVNSTNILIDHVNFLKALVFASTYSNCANIVVRGCSFTSDSFGHDGVHLDGPVEDVRISDCVFATGDDAIAVNCPEGYGGDISRVAVTNCIFDNALTVMRIYTSLGTSAMPTNNIHAARQIVVSNCVGSTRYCAFSLGINGGGGNESLSTADQIEDLLIENCDIMSDTSLSGLGWILFSDAVGFLQARGCVMRAPQSTAPFVMFNGTSAAGHIALSDITILRNADGSSTPALVDTTSAAGVGKLTISGARVTDAVGSSYTAIPAALNLANTVSELIVESLDMDHFTAPFGSAGTGNVTLARGTGLLATGAQIADSIMDNNCLYLSSNASGAPSIKVSGTAKRLTLA
jgi:hypothetical protein